MNSKNERKSEKMHLFQVWLFEALRRNVELREWEQLCKTKGERNSKIGREKRVLGSKDLGFYVFRILMCIVGKPWSKQCV